MSSMYAREAVLAVALLAASPAFAQNAKVSTLIPVTTPLTGTELFYVVQGGVSKRVTEHLEASPTSTRLRLGLPVPRSPPARS